MTAEAQPVERKAQGPRAPSVVQGMVVTSRNGISRDQTKQGQEVSGESLLNTKTSCHLVADQEEYTPFHTILLADRAAIIRKSSTRGKGPA